MSKVGRSDKQVFTFKVMYSGWECDEYAWVKERPDGSRYIVRTNHGSEFIASIEGLEEKVDEYQKAIDDTRKAISMCRQT